MANYKNVPWKRNLKFIPQNILDEIAGLDGDVFFVGVTKSLSEEQLRNYSDHLELPLRMGGIARTIPELDMGKYSTRNIEGWEIVRKDLPMIQKTYSTEAPNWNNSGTHTVYHTRDVYQREYHEAKRYEIEASVLQEPTVLGGNYSIHFRIDAELDRTSNDFEFDLAFMLNLLQENCGANGVFPSNTTQEELIATLKLDWEVFPAGSRDDFVAALTQGRKLPNVELRVVEDRVDLLERLQPLCYLKGTAEFGSYIGAKYADDLVVFENVQYGNAMYILYDNWEDISKRSRSELIRGTTARYDRIVHRSDWKALFRKIMRREKRERGL